MSSLTFHKLGNRAAAIANAEASLVIYKELDEPAATTVLTQLADWRSAM